MLQSLNGEHNQTVLVKSNIGDNCTQNSTRGGGGEWVRSRGDGGLGGSGVWGWGSRGGWGWGSRG